MRLERPDLEEQRNELIVNINQAKNELKASRSCNLVELLIFCVLTRVLKIPY